MADDKILCGNDVITRDTPEYMEFVATLQRTVQIADKLLKEVRPCLLNERYFTTEQVMELFHISRRALQNNRDKGIIPFAQKLKSRKCSKRTTTNQLSRNHNTKTRSD